ncbi:single-stranded DNA-binding protein [Akkermansiaceae bacterium]|nr:single-stranded DNA-binding protein [Akkermansiaceae bacterium]
MKFLIPVIDARENQTIIHYMNNFQDAENALKTLLGKLGFEISVEVTETEEGPVFNIISEDSEHIIGKNGDRIEDIQYLLNRVISQKDETIPRIKVDCEGYRKKQEEELLEAVVNLANKVKETGSSVKTRPLNSYYRRLVHNALVDVEGVSTSSQQLDSRFKRVTISKSV